MIPASHPKEPSREVIGVVPSSLDKVTIDQVMPKSLTEADTQEGLLWEKLQAYAPHIQELRGRILWSACTWIGSTLLAWASASHVVRFFKQIGTLQAHGMTVTFIQSTPGEVLGVHVKIAMILGSLVSVPLIVYHGIRFLLPALKPVECRWLLTLVSVALLLFSTGLWIGAVLVLPPTLAFFWQYGQGDATPYLTISHYIETCLLVTLLTGVLCELPIVVVVLGLLNFLNSQTLLKRWREALVIALLLAAILTPSQDPFTMILVTGLLLVLLGLSTFALMLLGK
ncbi:MAG: twin-arginine translocase subunit TatC [Vampirovibrionales bacterium]